MLLLLDSDDRSLSSACVHIVTQKNGSCANMKKIGAMTMMLTNFDDHHNSPLANDNVFLFFSCSLH